MTRMINAHTPAVLPQEAAMLPAVQASPGRPGRLCMPGRQADFVPVSEAAESRGQAVRSRSGSAAGRAILRARGISLPGAGAMARDRRRVIRVPASLWVEAPERV